MRRGSVIGPLILIGIGALFLLRNLWPDIPLVELISRYWPFVLIVWGGIRLIEILLWSMMAKPLPRNGISGGEWMLVFLICHRGRHDVHGAARPFLVSHQQRAGGASW